jgi:transposase-like protein
MCPNCEAQEKDCDITYYDAEIVTFKCRECGNKWTQKKGNYEHVELREHLDKKENETEKPKKRFHFF